MVSIITGTSQGLGKELAQQLQQQGDVIAINRSATATPGEILCDLADKSLVTKTTAALAAKFPATTEVLFILNAAVYGDDRTIEDIDLVPLGELVYSNVFSQLSIVEGLLNNGIQVKLVVISSSMGSIALAPESYHYAYSISKAGLNLSTRLLHKQFPNDLSYLIVDPGWMKTRMGGNAATEDPKQVAANIVKAMENSAHWNRAEGMLEVNTMKIISW